MKFDSKLTELLFLLSADGNADDAGEVEDVTYILFCEVADYVNNGVWHEDYAVANLAKNLVRSGDIPQAVIVHHHADDNVRMMRFPNNESAEITFEQLMGDTDTEE